MENRTMSRETFLEWQRRRSRWMLLLDTSEALLNLVTLAWGLQLIYIGLHGAQEVISASLQQMWPALPTQAIGALLIGIAVVHIAAILLDSPAGRRRMIFAQMTFFLYCLWALVLAHLAVPGVWILPIYIIACFINYFSLLRPSGVSVAEEPTCNRDK